MKKSHLIWALAGCLGLLLGGPYLLPLPSQEFHTPAELARPGGQFMTINGLRAYVELTGPASGPAVVLIHGFGVSSYSWRYTLPALGQAGYQAIALDLKGFGLTDKTFEADYTHAAQAEWVADVLDALHLQRATLVAHSMGSNVLAHFALKYPDRVEKLVIVDGVIVETNERGSWTSVLWFPPARRWAQLALQWFIANPHTTADWLRAAYADPTALTPDVLHTYLAPLTIRDWDLALLGIIRDSNQNALPRPFSTITAPTLIVWGAQDPWLPLATGERLHAQLPQAEWAVFADTGHMLMEERPAAFNVRLLKFLKSE